MPPRQRSRVRKQASARSIWCFTLNNYSEAEAKEYAETLESLGEYCFGREVGEDEKTPHLQGVFRLKKRQRLSALKKIFPRAHLEPCRSWAHSVKYCKKEGNWVSNIPPTPEEAGLLAHKARYERCVWRPWQQEVLDLMGTDPGKIVPIVRVGR